jgi:hypothetical protein
MAGGNQSYTGSGMKRMDKKPQDSITYEKENYQLTLESCFGTEKLVKVLKNLAVIEIHEQK